MIQSVTRTPQATCLRHLWADRGKYPGLCGDGGCQGQPGAPGLPVCLNTGQPDHRIGRGRCFWTFLPACLCTAGLLHLAGNMLYLWIFGDNVEDSLGPFKY